MKFRRKYNHKICETYNINCISIKSEKSDINGDNSKKRKVNTKRQSPKHVGEIPKRKRVRISSTFSVLRLAYFDLCTSTVCQIWTSYWSKYSLGRSTEKVELMRTQENL